MGCASGRESAGAFSLRGLKDGGLGEDLSRTFISFMLMYQKRFISLTSSVLGYGWQMVLIGFLLSL